MPISELSFSEVDATLLSEVRKRKIAMTAIVSFVFFLCLCAAASAAGSDPVPLDEDEVYRARVVTAEDASGQYQADAAQLVTVEFLDGPWQGEQRTLQNQLTGNPAYDIKVSEGDRVLVGQHGDQLYIMDFVRDTALKWMLVVFLVGLLIVGGLRGAKVLISLSLTGLAIYYILIPSLLRGYNPVAVTVLISAAVVSITVWLVLGRGAKSLAAAGGTVVGVAAAASVAHIFARLAHLMGLHSQEAQMLLFTADLEVDFRGLLLAGMILGALGAIMDVCVSIASSVQEVTRADPEMSFRSLFASGMNVGKDVLGTMTNTLVLAYVGTALPLLLLLGIHHMQRAKLFNLDVIATEVVRALSGSIGMVLCVPATAVLAAFMASRGSDRTPDSG